jgi:hypothetical protein
MIWTRVVQVLFIGGMAWVVVFAVRGLWREGGRG